jgi:hypothetical protein
MHGVKTFTIVTKSYLAYAKALAVKLQEFHPGASFTIFVVDPDGMGNEADGTNAKIRSAADLFDGDTFRLMTGYYTADELCNACKPWAHAALLREPSIKTTLYLDSDVYLTGSLKPLLEDLGGKSILLTPHVLKPVVDGANEGLERAFLNGGVFNGGCLALSSSADADTFLQWWKHRLLYQCLRFVPGLCVDQSWLNFVPALFPESSFVVCRRPGVNVGHWNMHERHLALDGCGGFTADGDPVMFLHFSGWDWRKPEIPSKYALTAPGPSSEAWSFAGLMFRDLLVNSGIEKISRLSYAYATAADGSPIDPEMRRRFLAAVKQGENDSNEIFLNPSKFRAQPAGAVSKLRRLIGLDA